MQIKGNIQVYCGDKLISRGQNLITNTGKQIFLDWLANSSYQNAGNYTLNKINSVYSNGVSLSSQRFVSDLSFQLYNGDTKDSQSLTDLSMFQNISNAIDVINQTLYISMINTRNICGIYINATGDSVGWNCAKQLKVYYSTQDISKSNTDNSWKLIKVIYTNCLDSSQLSTSKMVRFDSRYTTDGYVNAKSFKIQFDGYSTYRTKLRGIGLLEKTPYPNVPCVIGLGTSKVEPSLTDTDLGNVVCKLFVNKQLCGYEKTKEVVNTQNVVQSVTQFVKLDLNSTIPSEAQLSGINKINIIYISRLNYNQYNNIEFNEIGLFYPSKQVDYTNIATCDKLFSHGLFSQSWKKNSTQLIDIKYTISITV